MSTLRSQKFPIAFHAPQHHNKFFPNFKNKIKISFKRA